MITGLVTIDRTAVMPLEFKGNNDLTIGLQVTLDTGFSEFVSLPQAWIDTLSLPLIRYNEITLSNGDAIQVAIHEGVIIWDGKEQLVEIHCLESDPIVGMSLLIDFLLTLPVQVGAKFSLLSIPAINEETTIDP